MPERIRTGQNFSSLNSHPIRAAAKVTVCLSTTLRLIHNLQKKRNSRQSYSSHGENLLWPFYSDSIVTTVRIKKGKGDVKTVVQTTVKNPTHKGPRIGKAGRTTSEWKTSPSQSKPCLFKWRITDRTMFF